MKIQHLLLKDVSFVSVNGQIIPSDQAVFHQLSPAHYGLGFFEGGRVRKLKKHDGSLSETEGALFRIDDHLNRLQRSADVFGMILPFTKDELRVQAIELAQANRLIEGYLRINVTFDSDKMGLIHDKNKVNVFMAYWPWAKYHNIESATALCGSSYLIPTVNKGLARAKRASNYDFRMLALEEAKAYGADEVFLECLEWQTPDDSTGFIPKRMILEGSAQNIFLVKNIAGEIKVITPPTDYILDGITRKTVIEICQSFGIECIEQNFSFNDIDKQDSIFLTGTATGILPVGKIIRKADDTLVDVRLNKSDLVTQIQETYEEIVRGKIDDFAHLLTKIELN